MATLSVVSQCDVGVIAASFPVKEREWEHTPHVTPKGYGVMGTKKDEAVKDYEREKRVKEMHSWYYKTFIIGKNKRRK